MRGTPQQRFEAKYSKDPANGCWYWEAAPAVNGASGRGCAHGMFQMSPGRVYRASKASWLIYRPNEPIADGLQVQHICQNGGTCVNPNHLKLGTPAENMADMVAQGRGGATGRRVRPDEEKYICELYMEGHPVELIAWYTGWTNGTINDVARRNRLPKRKLGHPFGVGPGEGIVNQLGIVTS